MQKKFIVKDYIGKKFNKLTIIKESETKKESTYVFTVCDCGKESEASLSRIVRGVKKSCGCSMNKTIVNTKHQAMDYEIIGQQYGKLTVLEKTNKRKNGSIVYLCKCDCGNTKEVPASRLRKNITKSCGCIVPEKISNLQQWMKQYKRSAGSRNIKWELTEEHFEVLTSDNCYYCGQEPNNIIAATKSFQPYICNGIDRVNSEIGYINGNVVPCCKFCNMAKHTNTVQEFTDWIKKVYTFFIKQKNN